MSTAPPDDDILDALAGLTPGQADALRAHRPSAVRAARASYESLFPADLGEDAVPSFGLIERALVAARVAVLEQFAPAADHYLAMLDDDSAQALATGGADAAEARGCSRRARAVVRHTDLLVTRPAAASPSDLAALQAAGLSEADIVVLGQVAGFVSFQVRAAHGLAVLKEYL
jgi:CMD domain protein